MSAKQMRWAGLALMAAAGCAQAQDSCMVSPTTAQVVSGRFGKFRAGGAANFGSGNAKPHMHDGLDFTTGGVAAQVVATTAGTVTWAKMRGSAGNTVMIQRAGGATVAYYHLSSIMVHEGDTVAAGQPVGLSGNTGMGPGGAVHMHFVYAVPNADDARAKQFAADANKNPAFNPAQLPNAISKAAFGYPTDPSPYFCQTFPIQPDGLQTILGGDTMAQYNALFGSAPPMGVAPSTTWEGNQIAAANSDALQAAAKGVTGGNIATALSDADGYGSLPMPPMGDIETMSPAEMMATEAGRRFSDSEWNMNVTQVSSRALWVDYLRAVGVAAYMDKAISMKKERMEALLSLYTSQKMASMKNRTALAQARAVQAGVQQAVK